MGDRRSQQRTKDGGKIDMALDPTLIQLRQLQGRYKSCTGSGKVPVIWQFVMRTLITTTRTRTVRTYVRASLIVHYSQTSLVSTPGDPPNCYSLSVVLANHID